MSHYSLTLAQQVELEISENFIRCSAGIEDTNDLIEDIDQALAAVYGK